jgi:DNA-binding transcriptional MerR regulator
MKGELKMADRKTYGPKEVCRLAGITPRQLNYWRLIGIVNSRCETHSTKVFHRYTERDLKILQAIRQLTQEGYKVSKAAERVKAMMASDQDEFQGRSSLLSERLGGG